MIEGSKTRQQMSDESLQMCNNKNKTMGQDSLDAGDKNSTIRFVFFQSKNRCIIIIYFFMIFSYFYHTIVSCMCVFTTSDLPNVQDVLLFRSGSSKVSERRCERHTCVALRTEVLKNNHTTPQQQKLWWCFFSGERRPSVCHTVRLLYK